jgi:hypothetical protein
MREYHRILFSSSISGRRHPRPGCSGSKIRSARNRDSSLPTGVKSTLIFGADNLWPFIV